MEICVQEHSSWWWKAVVLLDWNLTLLPVKWSTYPAVRGTSKALLENQWCRHLAMVRPPAAADAQQDRQQCEKCNCPLQSCIKDTGARVLFLRDWLYYTLSSLLLWAMCILFVVVRVAQTPAVDVPLLIAPRSLGAAVAPKGHDRLGGAYLKYNLLPRELESLNFLARLQHVILLPNFIVLTRDC